MAEAGPHDRRQARARACSCPRSAPAGVAAGATQFGMRPRVRSGYALKRLDAERGQQALGAQGPRHAARSCGCRDNDAQLFELLDGTHSLVDLIGERRAALRARRAGAARAAAGRPRRARLPGRRRGRGTDGGRGAAGLLAAAVQAAREDRGRASATGSTRLYRRGGWVLFTRPALFAIARCSRSPGIGVVRLPGRRALRHAVRGRASKFGLGGARVPARALRGRGRARDRARADDGLVRPARPARRLQADRDLPLRVRGHLGGVVRAAQAADRDQRRRAGLGLRGRRDLLDLLPGAAARARCATSSSSSRSRATSARSSTSTRSSSATATTSSSTCLREPGLRRRAKDAVRAAAVAASGAATDSPVLARYSLCGLGLVGAGRARSRSSCRCATSRSCPGSSRPPTSSMAVLGTLWVAFFLPVIVVRRQAAARSRARPEPRPEG